MHSVLNGDYQMIFGGRTSCPKRSLLPLRTSCREHLSRLTHQGRTAATSQLISAASVSSILRTLVGVKVNLSGRPSPDRMQCRNDSAWRLPLTDTNRSPSIRRSHHSVLLFFISSIVCNYLLRGFIPPESCIFICGTYLCKITVYLTCERQHENHKTKTQKNH